MMKNIIMYDKKNKKLIYVYFDGDKPKFWQYKKLIDDSLDIIASVATSFTLATILVFSLKLGIALSLRKSLPGEILKDFYSDITIPKIESLINSSKNLIKEEKEFLCNEEFLNDIIKYIQGTHMDFTTLYRLNDLEIVPIDNIGINTNSIELGYYSLGNKLYIYDYDEKKLNEYFLDIVSYKGLVGHEYSHLLMANFDYRFLNEGIASIITDEYFAPINNSYTKLKIRTKVLIEIIGKEPIMECVYGNDPSSLIENIKKYLDNENEVTSFLNLLNKNEDGNFNYSGIDSYLTKMYFNKYGKELTSSEYMFCLYSNLYCNKGYLNDRLNTNGSYFLRNNYDNFYIYYRASISDNNALEPCIFINFSEEIPDLTEPVESYNNSDYVMVVYYYPTSLYENVKIDTLNNIVTYLDNGKEVLIPLEVAKEKKIVSCSYNYYKKSYENNLHTIISVDINKNSIYTFDNGIKKTINQVLLQKAKDYLNDLNSRQEISSQLDKSTKKLTLTNPNIAD